MPKFTKRYLSKLRAGKRAADPVKLVGPKNNKVALSAKRPTVQASGNSPLMPSMSFPTAQMDSARFRQLVDLIKQARDYNPDTAKAVDNFVSLCNPGYVLEVYYIDKKVEGSPVPDPEGLKLVQQLATRMFGEYSGSWGDFTGDLGMFPGLDAFLNMTHLTVATQGAMAAELELTPNLDDIIDIYPVDPGIVEFQIDKNTGRYVPGLAAVGKFSPLDTVRFKYIPKDPDPNRPIGRPPLTSVLDTVFFQQQFLRELQAIAHMTNSPRLDITILEELAISAMRSVRPDLMKAGKESERQDYLDGMLADIETAVNNLEADDVFVHYDSVKAEYITPGGTAIPVEQLMGIIDKMIVSGLKQLPLLLGRNEGATTTHATVQWQVFIKQLESYQRISRALATWLFNLYLRIKGRMSYVKFEYIPHKQSDVLVEAQATQLRTLAWGMAVDRGWASNDEAAMDLFGHVAVRRPTEDEVASAQNTAAEVGDSHNDTPLENALEEDGSTDNPEPTAEEDAGEN